VARYLLPIDEALELAKSELADGFLVNLRREMPSDPKRTSTTDEALDLTITLL
jgi:hypothetical protein